MQHKKLFLMPVVAGLLIVIVSGIALAVTQAAHAQCGSQTSSCKNCHEVQGQKPVNNDGTAWHTSHAFGDFCYICHGGNQQATDETAAHAGMVDPLSDINAACKSCHPNDLQARAKVYADKLGVQIGTGGAASGLGNGTATAAPAGAASNSAATPQAIAAQPAAPAAPVNQADLVNYVQRYNENALGQYPTNWGNVILWILIVAMVFGGGGLVISHEGLIRVSFKDNKPVEGEYPADVVDMVPSIAKMKPNARKSLRRLLEKPEAAADVLTSIDKLTEDKSSDQKS
jgi:hypothetical protein